MNFDVKLPECPICSDQTVHFSTIAAPGPTVKQIVEFQCTAEYARDAKADFNDTLKPYSSWSGWKCTNQCPRATEIALKLLAEKSKDIQRPERR